MASRRTLSGFRDPEQAWGGYVFSNAAEEVGFEPTAPLRARRFSKPLP
jgi:hypothetical protein